MKKLKGSPSSAIVTHTALRITPEKVTITRSTKTKLLGHQQVGLNPGVIVNGEVVDTGGLKVALEQLLKQMVLPDKFVTVGVPEHAVFVKTFSVHELPDSEVLAKIIWESEQELPLSPDDLYLDWSWLPGSTDQVQLVAIPRTVLDGYLKVIGELGLIPLAVESTSMTLRRLVKPAEQTLLVMEADTVSTLIIVEANLGINLSVVSQSTGPGKLSEDLASVVGEMIGFYQKKSGQTVGQLWFTGEFSNQVANLLPKEIPSQPLQVEAQVSPEASLGWSLAQMPVAPPNDPRTINLIPPNIQANYDQATAHHLQKRLLIMVAIFLLILNLVSGGLVVEIMRRQAALGSPGADTVASEDDLLGKIQLINQKSQAVVQIVTQKLVYSQVLNQVLTLIPAGLTINYLKMDATNNQGTLRGTAQTQQQVLDLKAALEGNPRFSQVNLPLSVLEKQENLDFSLTFIWKKDLQVTN